MEFLFKICAAVMVSLVLLLILGQQEKHIAVLLCIAICGMVITASADFLQPVLKLAKQLQRTAALDSGVLSVLLKSVAVAIISEITCLICTESGYGSLGKVLQFAAMTIILYFSLPLFGALLDLIEEILGGL